MSLLVFKFLKMKIQEKSFIFLCLIVSCYSTDFINPSFAAPSSGKRFGGAIVPWSEYRQKMMQHKNSLLSDEDSAQPVTMFLPPFELQNDTTLQKLNLEKNYNSSTNNILRNTNFSVSKELHQRRLPISMRNDSLILKPGLSYSTNTYKQPVVENTNFSSLSRPPLTHRYSQTPILRQLNAFTSVIGPEQSLLQPVSNRPQASANFYRGTPIVSNNGAQFSKLIPAPSSIIPTQNSDNFVNSIFSQSQYRHAPQQASAFGVPNTHGLNADLFSGNSESVGSRSAVSDNMFGGINPFQLLSTARDSPVEQIARVAKNLLSHENQELFAAMTKLLQKPAQQLTSSALTNIEKSIGEDNIQAIQLISPSANKDDNTTASKKSDFGNTDADTNTTQLTDKTENVLRTLKSEAKSENERELLEAAIRNNELMPESFGVFKTNQSLLSTYESIISSDHKALNWIQQNRPSKESKTSGKKKPLSSQDLPYYGRYCGVFAEQINATKSYEVGGALWVVDQSHLIVSKFHFKPQSINDNITFWAGPKRVTGSTRRDSWPSVNGVFLKPVPIDISVFTSKDYPILNATVRHLVVVSNDSKPTTKLHLKRDVFSNIYENRIPFKLHANFQESDKNLTVAPENATDGETLNITNSTLILNMTSTTTIVPSVNVAVIQKNTTKTPLLLTPDRNEIVPLEWYAGFQPMLLTLPNDMSIKNVQWISIFDHSKQVPVSVVFVPNGNAFQIPSTVQLRPFTAQPGYKVSSGPIMLKDTKTIEITDFSLQTNGIPVWFMVGKEVVPNGNGHILPLFDNDGFDCASLRDFHNETVTLRLPGVLKIQDIFWFSIFSIPHATSMAHMYLPYNDIHLPPDLNGQVTPMCQWI